MMPLLSIIIPTYNEEEHVGRLLDALNAQKEEGDEIIIVDSYSKDRTAQIAGMKGAKVIFQAKAGIGAAKTEGGRHAKNGLLVMLDADCIPHPDFLARIKNHFSDPELVALCGLDLYHSESWIREAVYNTYSVPVFWLARLVHGISGKYWLAANNCVIRKGVFLSVGGYRSVVCEDNDLMKRLPPSRNVRYDHRLVATLSDRRFREGGFLRTIFMWMAADLKVWLGAGDNAREYRK